MYLDSFNCVIFSGGLEFVFGFTKKFSRVACDDLDHVLVKVLGSKPLRIHLGFSKEI